MHEEEIVRLNVGMRDGYPLADLFLKRMLACLRVRGGFWEAAAISICCLYSSLRIVS